MLLVLLTYLPSILAVVLEIAILASSLIGVAHNPTPELYYLQLLHGFYFGWTHFATKTAIYWLGLITLSAVGIFAVEKVAFAELPGTVRQLALVDLILQMKKLVFSCKFNPDS